MCTLFCAEQTSQQCIDIIIADFIVFLFVRNNFFSEKVTTFNKFILCLFPFIVSVTIGGWAFAYAGPSTWNSLPSYLRDSSLSFSSFQHHLGLKHSFYHLISTHSAPEFFLYVTLSINWLLTMTCWLDIRPVYYYMYFAPLLTVLYKQHQESSRNAFLRRG